MLNEIRNILSVRICVSNIVRKNAPKIARSAAFLLVAACLSCLLFSCASTGFEGKGTLVGRVCDVNGNAVSGYRLSFAAGKKAVSGVNGVFAVNGMESGKFDMEGFGEGWSSVSEKIDFFDRRSVLVVQVDSESEVCERISDALRFGDIDEAERLLSKIERGNKNSPLFLFYSELVEYKKLLAAGKTEKAQSVKKKLDKKIALFE